MPSKQGDMSFLNLLMHMLTVQGHAKCRRRRHVCRAGGALLPISHVLVQVCMAPAVLSL